MKHSSLLSPMVFAVSALFAAGCSSNTVDPDDDDPTGETWVQATANTPFGARAYHATAAYDAGSGTRLWMSGGAPGGGSVDFALWSSADGTAWTQSTPTTGGTPTSDHALFPFNSGQGLRLWIISNQGVRSSSADALTWTPRAAEAIAFQRGIDEFVFNGRMWAIAGANPGRTNAVWSSADGIDWRRDVEHAAFTPRWEYAGTVFKNRMWVIGGISDADVEHDIWSSADGITWTLENANPPFSRRAGHEVVEYAGKLWLIGGYNGTTWYNDVWKSSDGVNWTLVTVNGGFPARTFHSATVFNNKIWIIGGWGGGEVYLSDVWSTGG